MNGENRRLILWCDAFSLQFFFCFLFLTLNLFLCKFSSSYFFHISYQHTWKDSVKIWMVISGMLCYPFAYFDRFTNGVYVYVCVYRKFSLSHWMKSTESTNNVFFIIIWWYAWRKKVHIVVGSSAYNRESEMFFFSQSNKKKSNIQRFAAKARVKVCLPNEKKIYYHPNTMDARFQAKKRRRKNMHHSFHDALPFTVYHIGENSRWNILHQCSTCLRWISIARKNRIKKNQASHYSAPKNKRERNIKCVSWIFRKGRWFNFFIESVFFSFLFIRACVSVCVFVLFVIHNFVHEHIQQYFVTNISEILLFVRV